jgi:hypothetical protein
VLSALIASFAESSLLLQLSELVGRARLARVQVCHLAGFDSRAAHSALRRCLCLLLLGYDFRGGQSSLDLLCFFQLLGEVRNSLEVFLDLLLRCVQLLLD